MFLKQNRGTVRQLTLNGFGHRPNTSLHRLYSLKFILPYPQNMEQLFIDVSRVSHRIIKSDSHMNDVLKNTFYFWKKSLWRDLLKQILQHFSWGNWFIGLMDYINHTHTHKYITINTIKKLFAILPNLQINLFGIDLPKMDRCKWLILLLTPQRQPVTKPETPAEYPSWEYKGFLSYEVNSVFSKRVRWQKHH